MMGAIRDGRLAAEVAMQRLGRHMTLAHGGTPDVDCARCQSLLGEAGLDLTRRGDVSD